MVSPKIAKRGTKKQATKKSAKASKPTAKATKVDIDNPIDPQKSYTSEQLCHALGIERTTLWRYRRQGLKSHQKGSRFFYRGSEVQEFLFGESAA